MSKVKILQIVPTGNYIYYIDDRGRVWVRTLDGDWEQVNLPDEPKQTTK